MTAQDPDLVRFEPDGEASSLYTNPLESWLDEHGVGLDLVGGHFVSTSNARNYIATFLVHDDHLWIDHIEPLRPAVVAAPRPRKASMGAYGTWEYSPPEPETEWKRRADRLHAMARAFDLDALFPRSDLAIIRDEADRVRADWYSGELRIPQGRMTSYFHADYASLFERDRLITIRRGRVLRDWVRVNG